MEQNPNQCRCYNQRSPANLVRGGAVYGGSTVKHFGESSTDVSSPRPEPSASSEEGQQACGVYNHGDDGNLEAQGLGGLTPSYHKYFGESSCMWSGQRLKPLPAPMNGRGPPCRRAVRFPQPLSLSPSVFLSLFLSGARASLFMSVV